MLLFSFKFKKTKTKFILKFNLIINIYCVINMRIQVTLYRHNLLCLEARLA